MYALPRAENRKDQNGKGTSKAYLGKALIFLAHFMARFRCRARSTFEISVRIITTTADFGSL